MRHAREPTLTFGLFREYDSMKHTIARYEQVLRENGLEHLAKGPSDQRKGTQVSVFSSWR
jgi:hypothetical protein